MVRGITVRGLVFSAMFTALVSVSSLFNISLGFTTVPISLENLMVMLAGAVLGPLYGLLSMLLLVALVALGLPLLHGAGGMPLLLGYTGGFVWMYPAAAWFIGFATQRIKGKSVLSFIATFVVLEVGGSLLLYVTGVPWAAHVLHWGLGKALALGCYPYLPGDAVKAFLAAWIVLPVRQVWPVARIVGRTQSPQTRTDY